MSLDTRTDTRPPTRSAPHGAGQPVRRTALVRERHDRDQRPGMPSRSLVAALALSAVTLMVVDSTTGDDSPLDPARRVVGEIVGPIQAGADTVLGPVVSLPGALRTNLQLREDNDALETENAALRRQLTATGYDEGRVAQLDGLRALAGDLGYALLPARVIAIGSAQSFNHTVTIDAGSSSGLHPDMTVVAAEGLVGRVTAVTAHTATVLLIADRESTVGGRVADSSELGFVEGRGALGDDGSLDLDLVDESVRPSVGETVVTWGSEGGAPYVAGVPIGEVTRVFESLRETSYRAVLEPAVDFTSLDLVGVVVPSGSQERVIEADGSVRLDGAASDEEARR